MGILEQLVADASQLTAKYRLDYTIRKWPDKDKFLIQAWQAGFHPCLKFQVTGETLTEAYTQFVSELNELGEIHFYLKGKNKKSPSTMSKRERVFYRDNYQCCICGTGIGISVNNLTVHHLSSQSKHPNLAKDFDNLITMCFKCHSNFHMACAIMKPFDPDNGKPETLEKRYRAWRRGITDAFKKAGKEFIY